MSNSGREEKNACLRKVSDAATAALLSQMSTRDLDLIDAYDLVIEDIGSEMDEGQTRLEELS